MTERQDFKRGITNSDLHSKINVQIIQGVKLSLRQERKALAEGLLFLGEFHDRRLYLDASFPNTFTYLTKVLNCSKASASKRVTTARAMRLYPDLYDLIAEGELHLSGAYLISKYLCQEITEERAKELIQMVRRKSKEEIEMELARLYPQELQKSWTRGFDLFPRPKEEENSSLPKKETVSPGNNLPKKETVSPGNDLLKDEAKTQDLFSDKIPDYSLISVEPRQTAKPVSESFVRLAVNLDKEAYQILKRIQDLSPGKDMGEILSDALKLLQEKKDPSKKAEKSVARKLQESKKEEKENPSTKENSTPKRPYISTKIKHEVYLRDNGQCTFINEEGIRCPATTGLQYDHIIPFAKGGETSVLNIRLRCAGHNLHHAIQSFGQAFIEKKIASSRQKQVP